MTTNPLLTVGWAGPTRTGDRAGPGTNAGGGLFRGGAALSLVLAAGRSSGAELVYIEEQGAGTTRIRRVILADLERGLTIPLTDAEVSKHHCSVRCDAGACHVVDAGSLNGTFVNGGKIGQHQPGTGVAAAAVTDGTRGHGLDR